MRSGGNSVSPHFVGGRSGPEPRYAPRPQPQGSSGLTPYERTGFNGRARLSVLHWVDSKGR